MDKIILRNINKYYQIDKNKKFQALKDINVKINEGEVYGIIGRSGAGKSTLIRLINLLERPSTGEVIINNEDITKFNNKKLIKLRQKIGMVFQHFNLLNSKTILENVILPLKISGYKGNAKERALELLEQVGLAQHVNKFPNQLSGGQKQRVGIARSLANNPEILLCDEATSALDPETTKEILTLLKNIANKYKLTIVLITHSMEVVKNICDKVAVIDKGELIEEGEVIDVFLDPKEDVTKYLLSESGLATNHWEVVNSKLIGKVFKLTYKGDNTTKPLLSDITAKHGISFNILEGTVGSLGDTKYGQLVINLDCDEPTYNLIKSSLQDEDIKVEDLN